MHAEYNLEYNLRVMKMRTSLNTSMLSLASQTLQDSGQADHACRMINPRRTHYTITGTGIFVVPLSLVLVPFRVFKAKYVHLHTTRYLLGVQRSRSYVYIGVSTCSFNSKS